MTAILETHHSHEAFRNRHYHGLLPAPDVHISIGMLVSALSVSFALGLGTQNQGFRSFAYRGH